MNDEQKPYAEMVEQSQAEFSRLNKDTGYDPQATVIPTVETDNDGPELFEPYDDEKEDCKKEEGPQRPNYPPQPSSYNNKLIVEAYAGDRTLKSEVKNGMAFVKQKVALAPLKLLANAHLNGGDVIYAGATIYIKEEHLHSAPWAKARFETEVFPGKQIMIVDLNHIEMVVRE